MTDIGKRIKDARLAAKLTQEQLGEMIGVTGVTIMRYETGQRKPGWVQIGKIADALETSQNYFWPGSYPEISLDDARALYKNRQNILNEEDCIISFISLMYKDRFSQNKGGITLKLPLYPYPDLTHEDYVDDLHISYEDISELTEAIRSHISTTMDILSRRLESRIVDANFANFLSALDKVEDSPKK